MEISNPFLENLIQSYSQKNVNKIPNLNSELNCFADMLKSELSDLRGTDAEILFDRSSSSSLENIYNQFSINSLNQLLLYSLIKSKLPDSITDNYQTQIYSQAKATYSKASTGDYDKMFNGDVFLGDSITKGLSAYNILNESRVYARVGAGTNKIEDMVDSALKQNPKRVFIMSGINDIGKISNDQFAQQYADLINSVKAKCPNAKIYVQAILPVLDQATQTNPNLNNDRIFQFNSELSRISKQENVNFLDTSALVSFNKDFYANDGIHFKPTFYPLWLNFLQTHAK